MATVNDSWKKRIDTAYNDCHSIDSGSNPVNAVGGAEYLRVSTAYETSKERIGLIARRILQAQGHDPVSFLRAEPLLAKNGLRIFYQENQAEATVEGIVLDPNDVEQLETYRINAIMFNRLYTNSPSSGGCSIQ